MIQLDRLTYFYPDTEKPVLEDLSLTIDEGEMLLVAGPSGCGKSSLLRTFNGLVPHFHGGRLQGDLRVADLDPVAVGPRGMSHVVGFVHQNPEAHFVTEIVEDELAFAMENHGIEPAQMRRRVEEVLDQLSIAHLRDRQVSTLSGGERQRVAIAGVLTLQPQILVLDEPTSQLDPQSAEEVLNALRTLNQDFGLTLVVAEHRLERIAHHVDRVLLMDGSGPIRIGTPEDLLADSPLAPPLVQLCAHFDWRPATLTLKDTRRRPEVKELRKQLTDQDEAAAQARTTDPAPQSLEPQSSEATVSVRAEGLWLAYEDHQVEALKGLDLTVTAGSLTALLGRNGSGKSTLLKALVGLLGVDRGDIRLRMDGKLVAPQDLELHEIAQSVGFLPQNPSRLLFQDTVDNELKWSLDQRRADSDAREAHGALAETLGLQRLGARHPRDLSTGERQRLALAVTLAGAPSILLLDEPTRGLDVAIKEVLADHLIALRHRGTTLIVATHDVELAARCADRVVLMGDGRVVTDGPTRPMLHQSPVFATQINRLFRHPDLHTLDDVRNYFSDAVPNVDQDAAQRMEP